jgi:hypothetical protein
MVLILEILLTVVCWRRGWKAWALTPLGVAFFTGFAIGVIAVMTGQESALDDLGGVFLLGDLACVLILIVMTAIGRKETASSSGYTSTFGAPV